MNEPIHIQVYHHIKYIFLIPNSFLLKLVHPSLQFAKLLVKISF